MIHKDQNTQFIVPFSNMAHILIDRTSGVWIQLLSKTSSYFSFGVCNDSLTSLQFDEG